MADTFFDGTAAFVVEAGADGITTSPTIKLKKLKLYKTSLLVSTNWPPLWPNRNRNGSDNGLIARDDGYARRNSQAL